jgi:hypothetical protein
VKGDPKPEEQIWEIQMFTDFEEDLILHWGIGRKNLNNWEKADEAFFPPKTKPFDEKSAQTLFINNLKHHHSFKSIYLSFPKDTLKALNFVFMLPEKVKTSFKWIL